ncbi:MAG: BtrH N-terminal domain-containing protein [Chloroflexota bacterium]
MPLQPLPGFRSLVTHHCITGSLRHVYEYNGYPISEELLLGLGAGVGFIYWHMKGTPPMYGGRANVGRPGEEGLEKTAGRRTGVRVEQLRTGRARQAGDALLAILEQGQPAMIMVDMGFLPYLGLPEGYHFGGHAVVVAGYDPESRQVLVADRDEELHPVSLADLAKARGSRFKPFPPQHTWFTFDFGDKRPPEAGEVREAIQEVTTRMLKPPIANLGVKGIRKAATATRQWPRVMSAEELRLACFNAFIFVDAMGGTGGGIFRYMYGRFLGEAAAITGDERLAAAGQDMQRIGDQWQEVARLLKAASEAHDPAPSLAEPTDLLQAIAEQEQRAWERLREAVGPA